MSLPGGTSEEQDRDLTATALRESYEEIGLRPEGVEILGQLGELVMPSGYRVTPVVGIIENDLDYVANPAEVDSIFLAPLSLVLDTEAYMRSTVTYRDIERTVLELQPATIASGARPRLSSIIWLSMLDPLRIEVKDSKENILLKQS